MHSLVPKLIFLNVYKKTLNNIDIYFKSTFKLKNSICAENLTNHKCLAETIFTKATYPWDHSLGPDMEYYQKISSYPFPVVIPRSE